MKFSYIFHYLFGISLAFAFDDLSHHKYATLSPIYTITTNYDASNAVDGNSLTCMRTNPIGLNSWDKTAWWKVDLGGIYRIHSINILFRSYDRYELRQRGRFAGFSLYVSTDDDGLKSSSLCYKDGPQLPPLNFTTFCIKSGRYVTFYNERLDREIYPQEYELANVYTELCEVIVKGCIDPGVYGSNCDIPCPVHCKNNDCHIQNGKCYECDPGWKGATCQIKCENGWYGENCSQQCVRNCVNKSTCNHVTGHCDVGCDVGWKGSICEKECENGWYGENCSKKCVRNCINNSTCNHVTGHCDLGCDVGWTGSICEKECENGWYGKNCSQQCVGNCIINSTCNHVTGHCDVGCDVGWTGSMCDKECENGWYGENCSQKCVRNCINNSTCNHATGHCDVGCDVGWTGSMCEKECDNGWYGENCSQQCVGNCINNSTCNHVTGHCDVGCDVGWTGSMCEKECAPGHFGAECMGNCSENCISNTHCDHINGECSDGCMDGYIGRRCENYTANNHLQIKNTNQPLLWIFGFSASVAVNAFLVACTCTLRRHWKKSSHKRADNADVPISLRSTSYARREVASIEPDHYQYVDLPNKEMCYQNMSFY